MSEVTTRPSLRILLLLLVIALVALPMAVLAGDDAAHPNQAGGLAGPGATATAAARAASQTSTQAAITATPAVPLGATTPSAAASPTSTETNVVALPTPTPQAPGEPVASPLTVPVTVPLTVPVATAATTGVTVTLAAGPVEGTIIANRTEATVRYFVEGATRDLEPLRSTGILLARPTAVLNLFNCDAALGEAQEGCFWDPYLLDRDGFYEVVSGRDAGALVSLVLREAGTPPSGEVWIQNRTGSAEQVYFGTQMYDLPASGIAEFAIESGGVGVFYLRTCVSSATDAPVCEWLAHPAAPGSYYALVADEWSGSLPGSTVVNLELEPVLGAGSAATESGATPMSVTVATPEMVCRLAVPALNVRSGPGLGFEIVKKVRSTDVDIATVIVVARTEDGQWLKVDERVATGGWVISGVEYLACDGDVNALPAVPATELPATPTPLPVVAAPSAPLTDAPAAELPPADASAPVTETAPAPGPAVPAGQGLLLVSNGFDQEIRFTLDQRHRVEQGASEFDLKPGDSVAIVVYPGTIEFTASSAWREISGNANFVLEPDTQRSIWLSFIPDPGEPGNWILVY